MFRAIIEHVDGYTAPATIVYQWSLTKYPQPSNTSVVVSLPGPSSNTTQLELAPGILEPNQHYYILFYLDFRPRYSMYFTFGRYFDTAATPVVADINGGTWVELYSTDPLVLDASESHDPDRAQGAVVEREWMCTRRSGALTVPEACSELSGSTNMSLTVLQVPGTTLSVGYIYNFTFVFRVVLSVSRPAPYIRSASASVEVSVTSQPITSVSIKTSVDGAAATESRVPSTGVLRLEANCMPHPQSTSTSQDLAFWWSVSPDTELALPGAQTSIIGLPPNFLEQGVSYTFMAIVRDPSTGVNTTATTVVTIALPPTNAAVVVSPAYGTEYSTEFIANASVQATELPIMYSYATTKATWERSKVLSAFINDATYTTVLSAGEQAVVVSVRDNLGVVVEAMSAKFNVSKYIPPTPVVSASCTSYADALGALKAILPVTNGTGGVCGQMNRGLQRMIDIGQVDRVLAILRFASPHVATLQRTTSDCAALLDLSGCDLTQGASGAIKMLDFNLLSAYNRIQYMPIVSDRATPSLVHTLTQMASERDMTVGEIINFTETAARIVTKASPRDVAYTVQGSDIAELLSTLALKGVNLASSGEEADPSMLPACDCVTSVFLKVESLLRRAGEALSPGMGDVRLNTSAFESRVVSVYANAQNDMTAFGSNYFLPEFKVPGRSGDEVISLVYVRWTSAMDRCRGIPFATLESDIVSLNAYGGFNAIGLNASVAAGEVINMTIAEREPRVSRRLSPGVDLSCTEAKTCRWWNSTARAWDDTGCVYNAPTGTCSCSRLAAYAVLIPQVECPSEIDDTNTSMSTVHIIVFSFLGFVGLLAIYSVIRYCLYYKNLPKVGIAPVEDAKKSPTRKRRDRMPGWSAWKMDPVEVKAREQPDPEPLQDDKTQPRPRSRSRTKRATRHTRTRSRGSPSPGAEPEGTPVHTPTLSVTCTPVMSDDMSDLTTTSEDEKVPCPDAMSVIPQVDALHSGHNKEAGRDWWRSKIRPMMIYDSSSSSESSSMSEFDSVQLPEALRGDVDPAAAAVVKAFNHRQDVCTSSDDTTASSSSDVQVQVQIPKNEFDNMEYIRRCKATFAQLTRKHDVETVLTKYDEFLSRPKERVLADPAYFYSGSV